MGMKKNKSQKSSPSVSEKEAKNHEGKRFITDDRFSKVHSDPRFQKVPKNKSKVAVDSRFSAALTNKAFAKSSAPLDKRGKLKKGASENSLSRYYSLEEEEEKEDEKKKKKKKRKSIEKEREMKKEESEETDSEPEYIESGDELEPLKPKSKDDDDDEEETSDNDLVDGDSSEEDVDMDSDASSSTTDTDDEAAADLDDDEDEAEVENVPIIEKETHRLAIVNMDWAQVKASDLFVMLSTILPKGGAVLSVSVYPSEFGLKRMEEEALRGPSLFNDEEENKDKDSDSDDDEIDTEKLRAYERSRLRYYYAVVVCDSVATADYLYKTCDGVEFERSSNFLDMRFIPDDAEFKHPPRDQVTEAPAGYEGLDFHTRALQHSNVQISWDEDEPHRVKTLKQNFNADQLADLEMKEFLASDESEEEEDDVAERKNKSLEKYRALLCSGDGSEEEEEEEEDEHQDMEVTFHTGLEGVSKKILEKKNQPESVWETYMRKRKEKRLKSKSKNSSDVESDYSDLASEDEPDDFFEEEGKKKKEKKKKKRGDIESSMDAGKEGAASAAELELLLADDDEGKNTMKGYKIKRKKLKGKKGKKEAVDEDKLPVVNRDDPRFAALDSDPNYALDPTDPRYLRSAPYARDLAQRSQRGREKMMNEDEVSVVDKSGPTPVNEQVNDERKSGSKEKHELSLLVKSVKRKSQKLPLMSDNGTKRRKS